MYAKIVLMTSVPAFKRLVVQIVTAARKLRMFCHLENKNVSIRKPICNTNMFVMLDVWINVRGEYYFR